MIKFVNALLIVILVVVPTTFGFSEMPTQMGLTIVGCSLALVFVNLDKFSSFKGAGFEAELRDAVEKAYAAVDDLKDLGLALTAPIINTMTVSDLMLKFIHLKHKLVAAERIKKTLERLGASTEEISDACQTLYQRVEDDHFRNVVHALNVANPDSAEVFIDFENWDWSEFDKARVEKLIVENSLTENGEVAEFIADLDYWLDNHVLRTEDRWQS